MIVFVHQGSELGGAERVLQTYASRLARQGRSTAHFCPYPGPLAEELDCVVYPHRHRLREVEHVVGAARALRRLAQGADVVVANGPRGRLYAALAALRPVVEIVHDPLHGALGRLRIPDATVFASHRAQDESAPHVRRRPRAQVIEAPIDLPRVDAARRGEQAERRLFVAVARLQEHKGHDTLLRAFARVVAEEPEARLVCAGDASMHAADGYADSLARRAPPHVTFAGFLPDEELYPLLERSTALVHAARHESLGLVLLEAMYLGRPVIATAAAGPRRVVVDGETGLLTAIDDDEALADAMLRVIREPDLAHRLGSGGRKRFETTFAPERAFAAFEALLAELTR